MRDCKNCTHYVEKVEIGKGSSPEHYWGCDSWECDFRSKGMSREEAIKHGKEQLEIFGGTHKEFIETSLETMRKYQKIEEIVADDYYLSDYNKIKDIKGVIAGNDD